MDSPHTFEDPVPDHSDYQIDITKVNFLASKLHKEIRAYCRNTGYTDVIIDIWKLRNIVISWKNDISKLQVFQNENFYPNKYKQAAYFIYWFVKVKPVFIEIPKPSHRHIAINEILAYHIGVILFLEIEPNEISNERFYDFIYQFYYRNTNPKQLYSTLELLDENVNFKRQKGNS